MTDEKNLNIHNGIIDKRGDIRGKLPMTAVLLAGGQSSRMKTNKAFLELGGKTLVEKSLEVLDPIFKEVIISANDQGLFQKFGKQIVSDVVKGQGPLGGLHAGLSKAAYDKVFFVACDMPFINAAMIRYMASLSRDYDIVIPAIEGSIHPLHGVYSRLCLPQIQKNLDEGLRKLRDLFPHFNVYYVERAELEGFGDLDQIFANVNTPEDWKALKDRAE